MDKTNLRSSRLETRQVTEKNGVRPYASEQTVENRAIFNKDREYLRIFVLAQSHKSTSTQQCTT
jgi:hypothetical protein